MARDVYISTNSLDFHLVDRLRSEGRYPPEFNLELSSGFSRSDALFLVEVAEKERDRTFLVHNYFPPPQHDLVLNLASRNDSLRKRSFAVCLEALSVCARVGAPFYSVHAGMALDPAPSELGGVFKGHAYADLAEAKKIFDQSIDKLSRRATDFGVDVLVENHVLRSANAREGKNNLLLLCGLDDFQDFDRAFPQSNVGMLLDLGHLKVSAETLGFDPVEALMSSRHRVAAVHVHDNDGFEDRHDPFSEESWFMDWITRLPEDVPFIIETRPQDTRSLLKLKRILERAE